MPNKSEFDATRDLQTLNDDSDYCPSAKASDLAKNLQMALPTIEEFLQQFSQKFEAIFEAITPYVKAIEPHVQAFVRYSKFVDAVSATGWLPYHTVSIDFVEECGEDVASLERHLSKFYAENWNTIRQDIESRIDQYHISEEAKATFREALAAHDSEHYRCVCRVLFPEIDRELRRHFFEDEAGPIYSEKMLRKLTSRGALEDYMPREAYGLILFGQLVNHLYKRIDNNNRGQFEQNDIPSRHASIHGLVHYKTYKHSVNMIIMADYLFQILTSTANLPSPQE